MTKYHFLFLLVFSCSCVPGDREPCTWKAIDPGKDFPLPKDSVCEDGRESLNYRARYRSFQERTIEIDIWSKSPDESSLVASFSFVIPNDKSGSVDYTKEGKLQVSGLAKPTIANITYTLSGEEPYIDIPKTEIEEDKVYTSKLSGTLNLEGVFAAEADLKHGCDKTLLKLENLKFDFEKSATVDFCVPLNP